MILLKTTLLFLCNILGVKAANIENISYEEDFKASRNGRFIQTIQSADNSTLITGVGVGTHLMKPNQVIRIHSEHYGESNYYHEESSWWTFKGDGCGVSATCPCFDLPSSFKCFGDFLKIADLPFYHQRFCGTVKPQGIYRSGSGDLSIRFRVDKRETGKGFLCFISCTEVGKADPVLPLIAPDDCFKALPARKNTITEIQPESPIIQQETAKKANGTKCLDGEIQVKDECYVLKNKGESLPAPEKASGNKPEIKLIESNLTPVGERG